MSEKNGPVLDLLGDPWTEARDPRGRKSHRRTVQNAETVALLRAGGATIEDIAAHLVLDPKTVSKYYSRELDNGPAFIRQVLDGVMWEEAKKGKASAAKFIRDSLDRGEIRAAHASVTRRGASAEPDAKPEKLGKKDERERAAHQVEGKFAPPAPPQLIN